MVEKSGNSADSGKEALTLEQLLAKFDEYAEEQVTSWDGLYSMLMSYVSTFRENPVYMAALASVNVLASFVLALQDLPEEQDALTIAKHMNRIMVMEPGRVGIIDYHKSEDLTTPQPSVPPAEALSAIVSVISALAGTRPVDDDIEPVMKPLDKRVLH